MVLIYSVKGKMLGVCELDKSKYMGVDIRDWFDIVDNKIVIKKAVSHDIEKFEVKNMCLVYERSSITQLEEL